MLAAQHQYGPDAATIRSAGEIILGRNQFKLLPEEDDDEQPLTIGGRFTLVADLRLDNRDELLARFGRSGMGGSRTSDAMLLLLGLEAVGERMLDLILGDFAFAAWDGRNRKLLLARDITGQRPLYFHRSRDFVAFATMAKGLHALPGIPRRPEPNQIINFIGLVPNLGDGTFYQAIERVRPAHVTTITEAGTSTSRYWNPVPVAVRQGSFDKLHEEFRAELDRAVRARTSGSGARLASHLSAGWDSSAVAATAARLLAPSSTQVVAYTAVPRRRSDASAVMHRFADEGPLAAAVAGLYPNMEHVLVEGRAESPIAGLDRLVELFDRPLATLCNNVWMSDIRARVRGAGASVLLTGELGNWSISSGPYAILAEYLREGRWRDWWREARAIARSGDARLRGVLFNSFEPWLPQRLARAAGRLSSRPPVTRHHALHPRLGAEIERRHERLRARRGGVPPYRLETVLALERYDFGNFRKGALAGWGIDERDPTSDRRLIEFCLSLPIDMLLENGKRRPLARAALSDRLPAALLDQKSKGYQAADWHEGLSAHRAQIEGLLEEITGNDLACSLLDIEALRSWVRNWPSGGWEQIDVMARYRNALLAALSAGHFILHASR